MRAAWLWTDQDVKTAADVPGHLRVIWTRSVLDDFIRNQAPLDSSMDFGTRGRFAMWGAGRYPTVCFCHGHSGQAGKPGQHPVNMIWTWPGQKYNRVYGVEGHTLPWWAQKQIGEHAQCTSHIPTRYLLTGMRSGATGWITTCSLIRMTKIAHVLNQ